MYLRDNNILITDVALFARSVVSIGYAAFLEDPITEVSIPG